MAVQVQPRPATGTGSMDRLLVKILIYLILALGAIIMIFPFYWMVLTSFRSFQEAIRFPPNLLPTDISLYNYGQVFDIQPNFGRYFLNSVIVASATTAMTIITSILAAYAFARMNFYGKNIIFLLFLSTMMIPGEVLIIPNFITVVRVLHWGDTYQAMIIPWAVSVFGIFLLRQFFLAIPNDLYEAAVLDGASHLRYLFSVVVPLSIPAIITLGLISFLGGWNALLWPLLVTRSADMRPIQVGLQSFTSEAGSQPELIMAASTLAMLPILVVYLFAQRQFIESIARTGVKG